MNDSIMLLVILVATAIAFDFTNGFHDTANAMATSIATRTLRHRAAVALCAL
jgi:inorganic phosphate transporter, PiT family